MDNIDELFSVFEEDSAPKRPGIGTTKPRIKPEQERYFHKLDEKHSIHD